jgi:hypothetical protein
MTGSPPDGRIQILHQVGVTFRKHASQRVLYGDADFLQIQWRSTYLPGHDLFIVRDHIYADEAGARVQCRAEE